MVIFYKEKEKKVNIKFLLVPIIAVMLFFGITLKADAFIQNENDIQITIQKLESLKETNIYSFVNKGEIIGNRLADFTMIYDTYISFLNSSISQLTEIRNEINKFSTMSDINEQERQAQIAKLYQSANTIVQNIYLQTNSFIYDVSKPMPTITYDRFKKKFITYYSSLGI